jgi:hypothetical protein
MITLGLMSQLAGKNIMETRLPLQLGTLIIAAGLFMIGFSIFKYDALFKESINKYEFKRLLFRALITSLIYVLTARFLFWLSGEEMYPLITPLLIVLVVLTIVPEPWIQKVLDRVMRPNTPPVIAPPVDAVVPKDNEQIKELRDMICSQIQTIFKFKNFHKNEMMANSQLFTLRLVQQAQEEFMAQNHLTYSIILSNEEKGRILRDFLTRYICQRFCPAPEQAPPKPPSDDWIEYLILVKSYLEGLTRKEVMREIHSECGIKLSGGSVYNKHLQNARQRLTDMLCRDEIGA